MELVEKLCDATVSPSDFVVHNVPEKVLTLSEVFPSNSCQIEGYWEMTNAEQLKERLMSGVGRHIAVAVQVRLGIKCPASTGEYPGYRARSFPALTVSICILSCMAILLVG